MFGDGRLNFGTGGEDFVLIQVSAFTVGQQFVQASRLSELVQFLACRLAAFAMEFFFFRCLLGLLRVFASATSVKGLTLFVSQSIGRVGKQIYKLRMTGLSQGNAHQICGELLQRALICRVVATPR